MINARFDCGEIKYSNPQPTKIKIKQVKKSKRIDKTHRFKVE